MRFLRYLKKGFTLVELLIFMGLLSILLLLITQIFVSVLNARIDTESISSIEQNGNYIMARVMYDTFRSTNVTIPATAGSQGSTLRIVVGGVNYTYALNGTNLELTNNLGTDRINGYDTSISNLVFKRVGNDSTQDSIQMTFTLTSNVIRHAGVETKNYQVTISPRQ